MAHAAPTFPLDFAICVLSIFNSLIMSSPNLFNCSRVMRASGPEIEIAAITFPSWPKTGAATATKPSSSSLSIIAKPALRTFSNSALSNERVVIVREVLV
ncbi:MAG: hypothetical protein RLZ15_439 [Actinomycetota bacterium]